MDSRRFDSLPDVIVNQEVTSAFLIGFGVLTALLICGFLYALHLRRKAEQDGIFTKYVMPDERHTRRRADRRD